MRDFTDFRWIGWNISSHSHINAATSHGLSQDSITLRLASASTLSAIVIRSLCQMQLDFVLEQRTFCYSLISDTSLSIREYWSEERPPSRWSSNSQYLCESLNKPIGLSLARLRKRCLLDIHILHRSLSKGVKVLSTKIAASTIDKLLANWPEGDMIENDPVKTFDLCLICKSTFKTWTWPFEKERRSRMPPARSRDCIRRETKGKGILSKHNSMVEVTYNRTNSDRSWLQQKTKGGDIATDEAEQSTQTQTSTNSLDSVWCQT